MNGQDFSPPHVDASRPSIGFPLGTALLLIIIFSLSGIFSCCYHWAKVRSLRRSYSQNSDLEAPPSKSKLVYTNMMQKEQSFPVIMPGDDIAKFIALPCPCKPLHDEKIVVEVEICPKPTLPNNDCLLELF